MFHPDWFFNFLWVLTLYNLVCWVMLSKVTLLVPWAPLSNACAHVAGNTIFQISCEDATVALNIWNAEWQRTLALNACSSRAANVPINLNSSETSHTCLLWSALRPSPCACERDGSTKKHRTFFPPGVEADLGSDLFVVKWVCGCGHFCLSLEVSRATPFSD